MSTTEEEPPQVQYSTFGAAADLLNCGFPEELQPGDVITDILAFVVILNKNGEVGLSVTTSEGMNWIMVSGVIHEAESIVMSHYMNTDKEDDEDDGGVSTA